MRRAAVVIAVTAAALAATAAALSRPTVTPPLDCASDRWDVKTLAKTDPFLAKVVAKPRRTTVAALQQRDRPAWDPSTGHSWSPRTPRQWQFLSPAEAARGLPPVETTEWKLTKVRLVEAKVEADLDIHLIVADTRRPFTEMTVEFPSTNCAGAFDSPYAASMARARDHLSAACGPFAGSGYTPLRGLATIRGVGFFDRPHGQKGDVQLDVDADPTKRAAKRLTIELHPALGFTGPTRAACRSR
ncbi:MAG TPA: hypothetical protein VI408_05275 [Gaiellaceae bacterium]